MRVLFVSPAAEMGGAERCLLDCIAAMQSLEPSVDVQLLSFADGPLLHKARALGAQSSILEPPPELSELGESDGEALSKYWNGVSLAPAAAGFVLRLRQAIARLQPDVVHTNGMKAHLLAGLVAPAKARLVVHLHDFIGRRRASKWLLPALARVRKRIVFMANSRAVAEDFARLAPDSDVRTVYNVVETDYFCPGPGEPDWLAELAGLSPPPVADICFGLVATYARWKGHELFIEAAGRLVTAHPERALRFYVVGGPIYRTRGSQVETSDLMRWARAAGIEGCFGVVRFQDDIARIYRSLNVVVHASTEPEPFGRTIVEAMACGRPVVVAAAGGAAELFQPGENAVGFVPGSVQGLADAMADVLDAAKRERLGIAARAHAQYNFGSARLAGELLAVYQAPLR